MTMKHSAGLPSIVIRLGTGEYGLITVTAKSPGLRETHGVIQERLQEVSMIRWGGGLCVEPV